MEVQLPGFCTFSVSFSLRGGQSRDFSTQQRVFVFGDPLGGCLAVHGWVYKKLGGGLGPWKNCPPPPVRSLNEYMVPTPGPKMFGTLHGWNFPKEVHAIRTKMTGIKNDKKNGRKFSTLGKWRDYFPFVTFFVRQVTQNSKKLSKRSSGSVFFEVFYLQGRSQNEVLQKLAPHWQVRTPHTPLYICKKLAPLAWVGGCGGVGGLGNISPIRLTPTIFDMPSPCNLCQNCLEVPFSPLEEFRLHFNKQVHKYPVWAK